MLQGYAQPLYINLVRDPVGQLVSNWYYTKDMLKQHYSQHSRRLNRHYQSKGPPWNRSFIDTHATLDECVLEAAEQAANVMGSGILDAFRAIPLDSSHESLARQQASGRRQHCTCIIARCQPTCPPPPFRCGLLSSAQEFDLIDSIGEQLRISPPLCLSAVRSGCTLPPPLLSSLC